MLKAFRDNLKRLKPLIWIVAISFVIGIAAVGGSFMEPTLGDSSVATVGSTDISIRQFEVEYRQMEQQMRQTYGDALTPELAQQLGISTQTLNTLVNVEILRQEAVRAGFRVTASELRNALLSDPSFQDAEGRFIGAKAYEQTLRRYGWTPDLYEEDVRGRLLQEKFFRSLGASLYIPDRELEKSYRDEVESARIRYISVPDERFAIDVEPGEEDLAAWFADHRDDFKRPEHRRIAYALVEPSLLQGTIELPDADVRSYYDSNTANYTVEEQVRARHILLKAADPAGVAAARTRLDAIRAQLDSGADFATLAREVSQDDSTADLGGELGLFARGRYNPALEEAAFSGAVGEIVGPVESDLVTQTGLHLIEILEHRDGGLRPFEEVSDQIRARLLSERSTAEAERLAKEIAARGATQALTAEDLRAWAESSPGAVFAEPPAFSRGDNVVGIGRGTALTTTAFDLELGKLSPATRVPTGWAILRVEEIQPERRQELDEVRDAVLAEVRSEKQREVALQQLAGLVSEVEGGLALETAASRLDVEIQESEAFGRGDLIPGIGFESELSEAVFARAQGEWGGPLATADGTVVFQVTERVEWDPIEFETNRSQTRQRLVGERANELLVSLLSRRREELEVTTNLQLLRDRGLLADDDFGALGDIG